MKKIRITEQDIHNLIRETIQQLYEDGATTCGNMVGGAGLSDPNSTSEKETGGPGFITPMSVSGKNGSNVISRDFYTDTLKRNKDEKNGSISMNRVK